MKFINKNGNDNDTPDIKDKKRRQNLIDNEKKAGSKFGKLTVDSLNDINFEYTGDYPSDDDYDMSEVLEMLPTTTDLIEYLDEYVIGQDEAKETLVIAVVNHLYIAVHNFSKDVMEKRVDPIKKQGLMIVGPSGTGKTYMVSLLCKYLELPKVIADATALTSAGYVGKDVNSLLEDMLRDAQGDLDAAEMGIMFIDEVDKIATKASSTGDRDVKGQEVQYGLLKLIEGSSQQVSLSQRQGSRSLPMDTSNMLFIFSGAFTELRENMKNNKEKLGIGFGSEVNKDVINKEILTEDLIEYGMVPELMGRIGKITKTKPLKKAELKRILLEVKGGMLYSYKKLFEIRGLDWPFKSDAVLANRIIKKATDKGLGARGLGPLLDAELHEYMLD